MIRRLLWKEFREQAPFALAALLVPGAIFLSAHVVVQDAEAVYGGPFLLLPLYAVLTGWGATRMPREREGGRLTLASLPVPSWRLLPLKALPGIAWGVCLVFAYGCGYRHYVHAAGGEIDIGFSDMWETAGLVALGYSSALLAGLFWGTAVSTVAGLLAGVGAVVLAESHYVEVAPGSYESHLDLAPLWGFVAALGVASACAMMARSRGTGPRRVGAATASPLVVFAAVVLAHSVSLSSEETEDWYSGIHGWAPRLQSGSLVAQVEDARGEGARRRYRIMMCDWDGNSLGVIERRGLPVSLAWTPQGELVFREVVQATRQDSLMLWSSATGELRVVGQRPAAPPRLAWSLSAFGLLAVEPNGNRVALIYPTRPSRFSRVANRELWVVNLRTGAQRLLYPDVDAGGLWWRRGRVYFEQGWTNRLFSSSPDGGGLRREYRLPAPSEGPSR